MMTEVQPLRRLSTLTVVAPFYNEEQGAQLFYQELCRHLNMLEVVYDFVFVDDGSHDKTLSVLNALANKDPRITVLSLSRNFGHQIALTAGLDYAEGEAVISMDSDLQHPPSSIAEMVEKYEQGADVVYAVRNNDDNRDIAKQLVAKGFYQIMRNVTQVRFVPGAVDFRLMSFRAVQAVRLMHETHRFLRGMVPWVGFNFAIINYHQQSRHIGTSRYGWRQLFGMARHGLFSFSTVPLDAITWLGMFITVCAMLYLLYVLVIYVTQPFDLPGWTSIIAVLLLVSGVQLISTGVLAQYVGMIFEQVKQRPLYILKQGPESPQFKGTRQPKHDSMPIDTLKSE